MSSTPPGQVRHAAPASIVDGVTFLATRWDGQLGPLDGLYHRDTRHLSELSVSIEGRQLSFVGSDVPRSDRRTLWYATDVTPASGLPWEATGDDAQSGLVLSRTQRVVEGAGLDERLTVWNHSPSPFDGAIGVEFDVDFADVFEVRGADAPPSRAVETSVSADGPAHRNAVTYGYGYQDAAGSDVQLSSAVGFGERPAVLEPGHARYPLELSPQASTSLDLSVRPGTPAREPSGRRQPREPGVGSPGAAAGEAPFAVETGHAGHDRTFERAFSDLRALTTETAHGPVAVAGAPWYAAVFGRDSLVAAYQAVPVAPELAVGTLRFLAAHQGSESDDWSDEQPGKILHELRQGELARSGRVPHSAYYGSVDATPLWIVLLHEAYRWLGDESLVEELRDPLEAALDWTDRACAAIGDDPFLYYRSAGSVDLVHKAWRDSNRSVRFRDGTPASPPLASAEVQGYLYDALRRAASLVRDVHDDEERAAEYETRAADLRRRFDDAFWLEDRAFHAAALTADGRRVDSLTSNVGQCLWSGIVEESRADAVVDRLTSDDLFTGWGVRTTSSRDDGYDPVAYHTGSVWPHDTSLVALGLSGYGYHDAAERLAVGLLDASTYFPHGSLPEVFCGFDSSWAPKPFPGTCVPQAWAAGAPLALLRALFGLEPGSGRRPRVTHEPSRVRSDAVEPVVEAWADGAPATVAGSDPR